MIIFKAPQSEVLAALQAIVGIVEKRHTIPILANVLIRKQGENSELITSDLERRKVHMPSTPHHHRHAQAHRYFAHALA